MTHNDALRSIASLLHMSDAQLVEIVRMGGGDVEVADLVRYRTSEGEAGFAPCPQKLMAQFLNGLVIYKRGKEEREAPAAAAETSVTNNVILKKLRVAFSLKDADVAAILAKGGLRVSKSERAAFFRHRDDRHYRECGDPVLQNFLNGLTL